MRSRGPERQADGASSALRIPPLPAGRTGDPGLFDPGSVFWKVNRERVLILAAPAAALLQIAHPLVAAAVAEHTDHTRPPLERLAATMATNLTVTFGDRHQAAEAAAHVGTIHQRTRGTLRAAAGRFAAGAAYDATDPDLLLWAHLTIVQVGLLAFERFVGPLGAEERDRYVDEARRFGEVFEVPAERMPATHAELVESFDAMIAGETLAVAGEALEQSKEALDPAVPAFLRPSIPLTRILAAGLLPDRLRRDFGLRWGRPQRTIFSATAATLRANARVLPGRLRWWPHYRTALRRAGIS